VLGKNDCIILKTDTECFFRVDLFMAPCPSLQAEKKQTLTLRTSSLVPRD
jgi:hypothetical protein